ncbi:glycosyltransferase family 1 protein [Flavobacterium ranwuense]|uniref:Glycosyltransferase family 1 protein n=1 Tax=Flavobacterium ranwuense TaxID=2541725 RepID=A0ABY2DUX5_9FLAO|nr:glycosyltransferase [Flavobacterium ranwuense]TDE31524.1 glycosyltransferase family 1 protein [Flavobacterium ranwuense]
MKKIKIAHILHSVGGVDVSLRLILENSNPLQFENIVIHGIVDTKEGFYDKNKVLVTEYKLPISREIAIANDFISIIKTYRILKKEKPDLIHCHSAKGGVIGRMVAILTGIPVVYTPQAFSYLSTNNNFKRMVFLFIEKLLSKGNVTLLASSKSEMNRAINEVGFDEENVLLFNNAIRPLTEINSLSIKKTWPDNYICTVGRPCYQKNIDEMIRVFYEVKKQQDIHLVIMGVGHYASQLRMIKKMISEFDLSNNITLLDWVSREDVLHIISKTQLYISTARYEGLPYSVIESLALSIPCIVSNCDGNKDLIVDNYNGYLINENDTIRFSKKVIQLLNDKNKHAVFSINAKKTFELNYNIIEKIKDLEAIYLSQKVK